MKLAVFYIYRIISSLVSVYSWLVLARILLSWIMPMSTSQGLYRFYEVVYKITEPPLRVVRNLIYKIFPSSRTMPVDFSPVVLFLIIDYVIMPIISTLFFSYFYNL